MANDAAVPTDLTEADTARRMSLPKLISIAAVVAMIYLAKDVLLPLSIAMLITFALSPLATRLRKLGMPHLPSVLSVVAAAFVAIGLFVLVVTSQLGSLAQNLPSFQANIITKVENLKDAGSGNGLVARLTKMIGIINKEIESVAPATSVETVKPAQTPNAGAGTGPATDAANGTPPAANTPDAVSPDTASPSTAPQTSAQTGADGAVAKATRPVKPMPVELVESQSPLDVLRSLILPLVSPIATVGLVIVVVIFMLLEREDLRDRFIKLVGSNDLHRTTQVLQEAGKRVAQYLLVQLLVNVIYAVPIGLGLFFIGVPNATLWGLLTLVLRFVPYIGSFLAAAFPLFLAFAVAPGWSAVLWTIALFGVVELVTSNVIEPYLYGSRTGVSPLAIIVSAIFWTWIWGPLGLVLSTPLTVCLVVLGRHIPQFEVFDILFGDDPVLAPHARLYQRLLVGDVLEATFRAEEALETAYISDYYRDIGIPALLIAQNDHARGVLTTDQQRRLASVTQAMVADLSPVVAEELQGNTPEGEVESTLPGQGYRILCMGGRSDLDDALAAMVAQAMASDGATTDQRLHSELAPSRFRALSLQDTDCIVLTFLDPMPSRASLLHVRRIKLAAPHLRVGLLICEMTSAEDGATESSLALSRVDEAVLAEARQIGADFAVKSLDDLTKAAFVKDAPKPLPKATKSARTRAPRTPIAAAAAR